MLTLREYIEQIQTKHEIRVKFACELTDECIDKIETHLEKYDAESISTPETLIMQKRPMDFPNVENAEVTIIDFVANLPVSVDKLRVDLAKMLRCSEGHIVVRNKKDPRETQDAAIVKSLEDSEKEVTPKLGTDYTDDEASGVKQEELAGNEFNTSLLKQLKELSDERKKRLPEQSKIEDPDVPASQPEIGDSSSTNKSSPLTKTRKK
jgi:hypothetical protein